MSARIFISHASENSNVADRIVSYLEGKGVPCWISSRDISPKEIYAEAITQAMREAQSCIVIVSDASNGSAAVKRELELASRYNKPFIPVRIDATEPGPGLDYYLNNTQWVDYGRDRDKALDRVVAAYAARTGASPAPATPPPRPTQAQRSPLLIPLIAVGALILGGAAWFALTQRPPVSSASDRAQDDLTTTDIVPTPAATALPGRYYWEGITCEQGPQIRLASGALVFVMDGEPTYRHRVVTAELADDVANVRTEVLEPEEFRGERYVLRLERSSGVLTVQRAGEINTWQRCPLE